MLPLHIQWLFVNHTVSKFSIHFACILHLGKHVKIDLEISVGMVSLLKGLDEFCKGIFVSYSGIFKNSKCLYCSVSFSVLCDIWPTRWIKLAWNNHCSCSIAFCPAFLSLLADFCFSIIVLALCPCAACCKANHLSYCFMCLHDICVDTVDIAAAAALHK